MSRIADTFFKTLDATRQMATTLAPGLNNIGHDLWHEVSRQVAHGSTELAAGLFNNNAFVMYGPSMAIASPQPVHGLEQHHQQEHANEAVHEHERGGMQR